MRIGNRSKDIKCEYISKRGKKKRGGGGGGGGRRVFFSHIQ